MKIILIKKKLFWWTFPADWLPLVLAITCNECATVSHRLLCEVLIKYPKFCPFYKFVSLKSRRDNSSNLLTSLGVTSTWWPRSYYRFCILLRNQWRALFLGGVTRKKENPKEKKIPFKEKTSLVVSLSTRKLFFSISANSPFSTPYSPSLLFLSLFPTPFPAFLLCHLFWL